MTREISLSRLRFGPVSFLMESVCDDWGEDDPIVRMAIDGAFDEDESLARWAFMVQSGQPGDLFLDVGSYTGLFALVGAKLRDDVHFALFEATSVTYGRAVRNIILNMIETLICPANFAAWDKSTVLEFPHRYGVYTMCPGESALESAPEADHVEQVLAVPLDCLLGPRDSLPGPLGARSLGLRNFGRVAGIKIDVEGAEETVLRGAAKILQEHRPVVICEILEQQKVDSVSKLLSEYRYTVSRIGDERNYLLVPNEMNDRLLADFAAWRQSNPAFGKVTGERVWSLSPRALAG